MDVKGRHNYAIYAYIFLVCTTGSAWSLKSQAGSPLLVRKYPLMFIGQKRALRSNFCLPFNWEDETLNANTAVVLVLSVTHTLFIFRESTMKSNSCVYQCTVCCAAVVIYSVQWEVKPLYSILERCGFSLVTMFLHIKVIDNLSTLWKRFCVILRLAKTVVEITSKS